MKSNGLLIKLNNITRTYKIGSEIINALNGVSLEIGKWAEVFQRMGYDCRYIAGKSDRPTDQSFVIEEADFPIRVTHDLQPLAHTRSCILPWRDAVSLHGAGVSPGQIEQVQHILVDDGVVHGATLEMPTVIQYLFGQFSTKNG